MIQTTVGVDNETREAIKAMANATGESMGEFIKRVIKDEMNRMDFDKLSSLLREKLEAAREDLG